MRWVTFKRLVLLAILVAFALTAMRITVPERARLTSLELKIKDTLAPVQGGLTWLGRKVYHLASLPAAMVNAANTNARLEREVARLQGEVIKLSEYELENQRLSNIIGYRQVVLKRYDFITASVIGRDPGNWFGTVTLNKGSSDGVRENMTVLTPEGLVGRVIASSAATSEVLLITDPRSGVGALIQEGRFPGIVEGTAASSGLARMVHIPNGASIEDGQVVITSGVGSIFPKGIPIGTVAGIRKEPSGLFKNADIQPFAQLSKLEEVLLITKVYPETANRTGSQ